MKKSESIGRSVRSWRVPGSNRLSGWALYSFLTFIAGTVAFTLYPVVADAVLNADEYRKTHQRLRAELIQAGVIPGQLKQVEDPGDPIKK